MFYAVSSLVAEVPRFRRRSPDCTVVVGVIICHWTVETVTYVNESPFHVHVGDLSTLIWPSGPPARSSIDLRICYGYGAALRAPIEGLRLAQRPRAPTPVDIK